MAHKNVTPQRLNDENHHAANAEHAQESRNLLERGDGFGMLSTIQADNKFPFGSVVNFALDEQGRILFFASKLAEHYQNILADERCSLLVVDETKTDTGDRLSLSRVTVLGKAAVLEKTPAVCDVLHNRHPSTKKYAHWDDFVVIGITQVEHVRYIKGFGEMSWIAGGEFAKTTLDPVSVSSAYAVKLMNDDHKEHVVKMIKAFTSHKDAMEAVVLRFDRMGMDCLCKTSEEGRMMPVRIPFEARIKESSELRTVMKDMANRAEMALGGANGS